MSLSPLFKLRNEATPALLKLLSNTTLGTNGAQYKHLDTADRIAEADNPLFLSLERNNNVLGNVTFCKRNDDWYIRYFAFSSLFQASGRSTGKLKQNTLLKNELRQFFDDAFEGKYTDGKHIQSMFAYIDLKNSRSKWMSEQFGFNTIAQLVTQTYSRLYPKPSKRLRKINDWKIIEPFVMKQFGQHCYFDTTHTQNPPFYALYDNHNELVAFAKINHVHWEIVRLPGKLGGLLTKLIPHIPFLNKLIQPKAHTFIVPELVYCKNNDSLLLDELFSAILASEKKTVMIWWVDQNDPMYLAVQKNTKWGLLNQLLGVSKVAVVQRKHSENIATYKSPIFVSAWDLI